MKKFCFVFLFLLVGFLFAEEKIISGYAGIPWGASVKEVKEKFPELQDENKWLKSNLPEEDIYTFYNPDSSLVRVFHFYQGKLFWGRTAYFNTNESVAKNVVTKLIQIYGNFDDNGSSETGGENSTWLKWNVNKDLKILLEAKDNFNQLGRIESNSLFIDYVEPTIYSKVMDLRQEKALEDIEL